MRVKQCIQTGNTSYCIQYVFTVYRNLIRVQVLNKSHDWNEIRQMKKSKKTVAFETLKHRVLTLDLVPGAPLDETVLAEEYGLSRTPMREVLQRLAGQGYISLENNRGASVSSMDMITMRNFFQSAPMIYAAIARLATEQATPTQIDELKKAQKAFRNAVNKNAVADMVLHNHRFHEITGIMSDSKYLTPSLGRLLIDHTRMSHRFYTTDQKASKTRKNQSSRIFEACDQHDEMIEAIEQRQAARAVDLTLKHWELSRSEMEKYVSPDPLPNDAISMDPGAASTQSFRDVETV